MRTIPDQLNSKNLVPFRKRRGRYKIPGMAPENEVLMDRVDPGLTQEEQSYIRHYLGYADAFIRAAEENPFAEPSEPNLPENAQSSNEGPPEQPPAAQPRVRLVEEPSPTTDDNPVRAA